MARKAPPPNSVPAWPIQEERPFRFQAPEPSSGDREICSEMERSPNPTVRMLEWWLAHPSEPVVLEALRRYGPGYLTSYTGGSPATELGKRLGQVVAARGIEAARAEGVLWNPIIDRLLEVQAPYDEVFAQVDPVLLHPLFAWVERQRDPAALYELVEAPRSVRLRGGVPKRVQVMDERILSAAFVRHEERYPYLRANAWSACPALGEAEGERFWSWALEEWARSTRTRPRESNLWSVTPIPTLKALIRRFPPSPATRRAFFQAMEEGRPGGFYLAGEILECLKPSPEELNDCWKALVRHPELLAGYPGLTGEQAHHLIAYVSQSARVLAALAQNPEAVRHPEVQKRLLKSRSARVLDGLALEGLPTEMLPEFFPRYLRLRPKEALAALLEQRLPEEFVRTLDARVLLEALQHRDPAVRLLAIQASTRLGEAPGRGARGGKEGGPPGQRRVG